MSASRLRALDLDRTLWGVRSASPVATLDERCHLLRARLPERAFFSHVTAALLLGIPVPWALENDRTLHVGVPAPTRALSANGIVGHRLDLMDRDLVARRSLRLTSPVRTWCDLAELVPLLDLVAAGDFLIHWRDPIATVSELSAAIEHRASRRGVRALRHAVARLNDRSESPPESKLRVIIVDAGLPMPRVNHSVSDRFGEFVARTDLIIDAYRIILEYQGDYHRTVKGQWRADMTRRSRLEAQGWRVMEPNADDLLDPAELTARILDLARLPFLPLG